MIVGVAMPVSVSVAVSFIRCFFRRNGVGAHRLGGQHRLDQQALNNLGTDAEMAAQLPDGHPSDIARPVEAIHSDMKQPSANNDDPRVFTAGAFSSDDDGGIRIRVMNRLRDRQRNDPGPKPRGAGHSSKRIQGIAARSGSLPGLASYLGNSLRYSAPAPKPFYNGF
jgi:hypothetical protein